MAAKNFTGGSSAVMVRVMKLIHSGVNLDAWELADRAFTTRRNLDYYLSILKKCGLVRITGWKRKVGKGAAWMALYGWGGSERDEPVPRKTSDRRFDVEGSALALKIITYIKEYGPCTTAEVAYGLNLSEEHARLTMSEMRYQRAIHRTGWTKSPKLVTIPTYSAGDGKDAPRPPKVTRCQSTANRKKRLKAKFGDEIAKAIYTSRGEGGAARIVIDGKTVYERRQANPT